MKAINAEQILETQRMRLEPLLPQHAALLYLPLQDPRLYSFIPVDPPISIVALETRYIKLLDRKSPTANELWLNWALRTKETSQYIGLLEATIFSDATAKLAYMIFPDYWHQGYGREGCKEVLNYLFQNYQIEKVITEIDTRNTRSLRLVETLGFHKARYFKDADFFKGTSSDEYHYELKREDYFIGNDIPSVSF